MINTCDPWIAETLGKKLSLKPWSEKISAQSSAALKILQERRAPVRAIQKDWLDAGWRPVGRVGLRRCLTCEAICKTRRIGGRTRHA